jgi:hypothetical protein
MANDEHVALLKRGVDAWNEWRREYPDIRPDLSEADLSGANLILARLYQANLSGANLSGANLDRANLEADLSGANLSGAHLQEAVLLKAYLIGANLILARLYQANLDGANLDRANLSGAHLEEARLYRANLSEADLSGANLDGANLRGADLSGANLIGANLSGAQKVRDVIDTITSKAVLILGRFTDERKAVLDALREELRKRNYLPILFDSSVPTTRDITETVSLLARMSRFVVADITDAKSIPQELAVIVPDLPSVPVQPLLLEGSDEYSMFEHFRRYPWVLDIYRYPSPERLIADLGERVIDPAEKWRSVR